MTPVSDQAAIDYLVVGHVCHDITPSGKVAGGTAVYSALAAQALGCRTAVLTSAGSDYDFEKVLPGIAIHNVPADRTTTFENYYTPSGRQQVLHAVAKTLEANHVPQLWQRASIVHLGPVAREIAPDLVRLFSNSLIGLTPQGWYRGWDGDGRISARDWPEAAEVIPFAAAVILSMEDVPGKKTFNTIRQLSPLVVLTQRSDGCIVYCRDEARRIPAPSVTEVNPTGAGDIYATTFLIRLHQTKGNPWEAAAFANRIAAHSVEHDSLPAKLKAIKDLVGLQD